MCQRYVESRTQSSPVLANLTFSLRSYTIATHALHERWQLKLLVVCSGESTLRSGSAESERLRGQQRAHALQRAQFRSRSRHGHVLATGTRIQHLPFHNGR